MSLAPAPGLKRALGVPLLVFYGLGVTVGAGIFALIGEILGIAGDQAPLAFLVAGLLAGATARSYGLLSRRYPRAAGEAIYAGAGFGPVAGQIAGLGVALVGIVSSAVIALAFAGYVAALVPLPIEVLALLLLAVLAGIAMIGIRESVAFAAIITVIEVGTLVVVCLFGLPELGRLSTWQTALLSPLNLGALTVVLPAAAVAFFAFVGFEDIVNLAEEVKRPERSLGLAIAITLVVTTLLYVVLAVIATAAPDRAAVADSQAPLATLFAQLSGGSGAAISVLAAVAMVNGVLVQVVMASRVAYGMAREGMLPAWLGVVEPRRQTPARAILVVVILVALLALAAPLLTLAQATSYAILGVFTLVNLSLWRIGLTSDDAEFRRKAWWGLVAAGLTGALLLFELIRLAV